MHDFDHNPEHSASTFFHHMAIRGFTYRKYLPSGYCIVHMSTQEPKYSRVCINLFFFFISFNCLQSRYNMIGKCLYIEDVMVEIHLPFLLLLLILSHVCERAIWANV